MAKKTVILNPHVATEEEERRDEIEDHDLSEWAKDVEENEDDKEE